ncbi:MAG: DNA polymerase III subunit delta, partial [Candidatus Omnitrophota bacterium]
STMPKGDEDFVLIFTFVSQSGTRYMIIFLYGEDSYRSREKLNEIIGRYKESHKNELNLRRFEGEDLDFQDFKNEFQTVPMFKEKKLLILSNVFSNKNFKEEFLKSSDKLTNSDHVIVFYEDKTVVQNDSLFKFLKKEAKAQEFQVLGRQKLRGWLKKEFSKYQTEVEPLVLDKLIESVGNNLWQLNNEVKKLSAFKKSGKIIIKDVELLVKSKIDTDIFKTIDALALGHKKQALNLLHQHLEKGDSPLYLLTMINYQFRNILEIKDLLERGLPLSRSKLHPFVVKKSYSQAQKFTFSELKKIYRKIFEVDYNIKTGKLEPQTALDLLIAEI